MRFDSSLGQRATASASGSMCTQLLAQAGTLNLLVTWPRCTELRKNGLTSFFNSAYSNHSWLSERSFKVVFSGQHGPPTPTRKKYSHEESSCSCWRPRWSGRRRRPRCHPRRSWHVKNADGTQSTVKLNADFSVKRRSRLTHPFHSPRWWRRSKGWRHWRFLAGILAWPT